MNLNDLSTLTDADWASMRALFGERLNTFGQRLYESVSTAVQKESLCNDHPAGQLSDGAATAEHVSKF